MDAYKADHVRARTFSPVLLPCFSFSPFVSRLFLNKSHRSDQLFRANCDSTFFFLPVFPCSRVWMLTTSTFVSLNDAYFYRMDGEYSSSLFEKRNLYISGEEINARKLWTFCYLFGNFVIAFKKKLSLSRVVLKGFWVYSVSYDEQDTLERSKYE